MDAIPGFNNVNINVVEKGEFSEFSENAGIIYPGQSYYLYAPALFYLQPVFLEQRIQYLGIDTRYGENPDYLNADPETRTAWINGDSRAIGEYLKLKVRNYRRKIHTAKSLGTLHLYNLVKNGYLASDELLIFLTPIMPFQELRAALLERGNRSLVVYGTRDHVIEKRNLGTMRPEKNIGVLELENAGHAFEDEHSVERSIDNLKTVITAIRDFTALPS